MSIGSHGPSSPGSVSVNCTVSSRASSYCSQLPYGTAYNLGYNFGEGIEDTVSGMFKMPTLDEMGFDDFGNNLEGIYGNTGDTAANTAATADAIEYTAEDLKYLRTLPNGKQSTGVWV